MTNMEIGKCAVRCASCHRKRHAFERAMRVIVRDLGGRTVSHSYPYSERAFGSFPRPWPALRSRGSAKKF